MAQKEEEFTLCSASKQIAEKPLDDEGAANTLLEQLKISTNCAKHPDYPVKCFCEEDNDFCCEVCVSDSHNMCKNIKYINDTYTQDIREIDIQYVKMLIDKVNNLIKEGTISINQIEHEATGYLSNAEKIICAKKKKGEVFQEIQEKVNSKKVKVISVLSSRITVLRKLLEKLHDCVCLLELKKLSPTQSIIARHKLFSFAQKEFDDSRAVLLKDIPELKMFIQEQKIFKIFSRTRFDIFIKYKKPDVSGFSLLCNDILTRLFLHLFNKPMAQIGRDPYPLITCNISFVASAERSKIHAGKNTPDGTYLPDNTILLCDSDNKQLIVLDKNLGFLKKLPVASKPYGACVSSNGNGVHVVCDMNKVLSFTLQGPWREVQRFGTENGAYGITCHADRIVTGCSTSDGGYVVVYDSLGTEISRIKTSGSSHYPVLSHDGRMLYHGDGFFDVVCRSMRDVTQEEWRYSMQKLQGPCGIDTDRDGNILIVGKLSYDIHQVSGNGNLNRILVNKMKYIKLPLGLFSNRIDNTFCVTSEFGGKVCVEMYRFDD